MCESVRDCSCHTGISTNRACHAAYNLGSQSGAMVLVTNASTALRACAGVANDAPAARTASRCISPIHSGNASAGRPSSATVHAARRSGGGFPPACPRDATLSQKSSSARLRQEFGARLAELRGSISAAGIIPVRTTSCITASRPAMETTHPDPGPTSSSLAVAWNTRRSVGSNALHAAVSVRWASSRPSPPRAPSSGVGTARLQSVDSDSGARTWTIQSWNAFCA